MILTDDRNYFKVSNFPLKFIKNGVGQKSKKNKKNEEIF